MDAQRPTEFEDLAPVRWEREDDVVVAAPRTRHALRMQFRFRAADRRAQANAPRGIRAHERASLGAAVVVLGAVALLTACPPGPVDGGPEPAADAGAPENEPEALAADSYCEETVDAFCGFYLRCGRMAAPDLDACRSLFLESCNAKYERRYVDLVDADLLTLSATGVAACNVHLATVTCEEQILDLDGACAQMWVGTVEAEGACGFDVETFVCGEGTACVLGLDLCGTCRVVVEVGAECSSENGTTCETTATCAGGVCVARAAAGESCAEGQRCRLGAQCIAGICRGPDYGGPGSTCDQGRRCPYGTDCVGGRCVVQARHGEGCGIAGCATGYCDAAGTCTPPQEDGEICADGSQCAGGRCVGGVCAGLPSTCLESE